MMGLDGGIKGTQTFTDQHTEYGPSFELAKTQSKESRTKRCLNLPEGGPLHIPVGNEGGGGGGGGRGGKNKKQVAKMMQSKKQVIQKYYHKVLIATKNAHAKNMDMVAGKCVLG